MGSHYKGTAKEVRALSAFINLSRAMSSLETRLMPSLNSSGLTDSQFGTLEALLHLGPLCQAEIGKKILRSGGNITLVVDNLAKARLVRRRRDSRDRRFVTVFLTTKGRKLIGRVVPRQVKRIVREMGNLTPTEQETLRQLCRKLGKGGDKTSRKGDHK